MIIKVLPALENKAAWLSFCASEEPQCFVSSPAALVDFQTTYLQITLLEENDDLGIKYSLGARNSIEPAWSLIKGCNWRLSELISGLASMDFSSNVRDNSMLQVHTDLTLRRSYTRDRQVLSGLTTGELAPLTVKPDNWLLSDLVRLLAHHHYKDLRWEQKRIGESKTQDHLSHHATYLMLALELNSPSSQWQIEPQPKRVYLYRNGTPYLSLIPKIKSRTKRLARDF